MKHDPKLIQMALQRGAVTIGRGFKTVQGKKTEEEAIVFGIPKKLPITQAMAMAFPRKMDGILTDVIETEMPRALQNPAGRFRPCPGGVSIGHHLITAGTLGCWVYKDGRKVILSNNHVLANSNDAQIGDFILQPGPYDGGERPQDVVASLLDFVKLHFMGEESGCKYSQIEKSVLNARNAMLGRKTRYDIVVPNADYNLIDAAIAEPLDPADIDDEILNIGKITGVIEGELGLDVQKMGRTTGLQRGTISQVDVLTTVSYGGAKIAVFEDQLLIEPGGFSAGGDSGSAILDMNRKLCGLLFAGSDTVTIASRIQNVFSELGISI